MRAGMLYMTVKRSKLDTQSVKACNPQYKTDKKDQRLATQTINLSTINRLKQRKVYNKNQSL